MGKRPLQPAGMRTRGTYSPGWEVSGGRLVYVAGQVTKVVLSLRQPLAAELELRGVRCDDGVPLRFWARDELPPTDGWQELGEAVRTIPPSPATGWRRYSYGGYMLFTQPGRHVLQLSDGGRVVDSVRVDVAVI